MASIQKAAKGFRAQIKLAGQRDSQVFPTKREAVEWAAKRESEIRDHAYKPAGDLHTLRQALRKYSDEVSPHRRGEQWEQIRLAVSRATSRRSISPLSKISPWHIAEFRDAYSNNIGPQDCAARVQFIGVARSTRP